MRRFSDRQSASTLAELNITPLLDLAFVLLIIFMITTPLMDKSVDLVVPSSKAADGAVDPAKVQSIAVNKAGILTLNGETLGLEDLASRLETLPDRERSAVVIRAHKELPVQQLVDVLDVVKAAKITRIGVVTTEEK